LTSFEISFKNDVTDIGIDLSLAIFQILFPTSLIIKCPVIPILASCSTLKSFQKVPIKFDESGSRICFSFAVPQVPVPFSFVGDASVTAP
jgi:hypothetical protein